LAKTEQKVRIEKQLFQTTLLSVGDGIISTDEKGKVIILNSVAEKLTGWSQLDAYGKPIQDIFIVIDDATGKQCINFSNIILEGGKTSDLPTNMYLLSKDNSKIPIEYNASPVKDENDHIIGIVLVFRDFSDKKKNLDSIKYLSEHDYLTGLYNRGFFEQKIKEIDNETNLPLTIILSDVNGLKLINDSFGHDAGDNMLKIVANIIKQFSEKDDIIARIGGDEMAIILPKTDEKEAKVFIDKIQGKISKEKIRGINISLSFGLSTKVNADRSIISVLNKAEEIMYNNKMNEKPKTNREMINNMMKVLFERSPIEKIHARQVTKICMEIGKAAELNEKDIKTLRLLGFYHDIGKIIISDHILNKKTQLNEKEFEEIRRHCEIGYRILNIDHELSEIAKFVLYHHERIDGKGYPAGLKGKNIPLFSRICSIAEAYDSMIRLNGPKKTMSVVEACAELKKHSRKQFDARLVNLFVEEVVPILD
jgi:diguanylate cyclase